MLKIKEYVRMSSDYKYFDVIRIINVCAKHNIEITFAEAEELWSTYSDDYCAQWLGLPDSDEYLHEIILEQAKKMWKLED